MFQHRSHDYLNYHEMENMSDFLMNFSLYCYITSTTFILRPPCFTDSLASVVLLAFSFFFCEKFVLLDLFYVAPWIKFFFFFSYYDFILHLLLYVAPVIDGTTQHLMDENVRLLSQIAANIDRCQVCYLPS